MTIRDFPIPGQQYKVKETDSLARLANMAYGDSLKSRRIRDANVSVIETKVDADGILQEYFITGELIIIPELIERKNF